MKPIEDPVMVGHGWFVTSSNGIHRSSKCEMPSSPA